MSELELFAFSGAGRSLSDLAEGGVDTLVIDWETFGKRERQVGADTEINQEDAEDVERAVATGARVACRLNRFGPWTRSELDLAVGSGAGEVLLPMVTSPEEVTPVLDWAAGRAAVGILVETPEAIRCREALGALPISRVYVGLNDLSIIRGHRNIFVPLLDGTVEQLRNSFEVPFGFGGLTLPGRGAPVPCHLLMGEMVRLGCQFSFLRRSFRRDTGGTDIRRHVDDIHAAWQDMAARSAEEVRADHEELIRVLREVAA